MEYNNPVKWKALHGLNIKTINIVPIYSIVDHVESSKLLSSLTQLEMLSIKVKYIGFDLLKALHGLNIKNLNGLMGHIDVKSVE
ncbi:hypothetical protein DPMN_061271 [Dreissena polymorpha]|uniref:Uncharacterized protein n=1 Tax=Dreissena polymorpha TaxID=45954 RepID=A0A9D4C6P9_DREPO|nr:hypothetical protein DPMN_061271 [Dreissena polymorpha]